MTDGIIKTARPKERNGEFLHQIEDWVEILKEEDDSLGYAMYPKDFLLYFLSQGWPANRKWFSEKEIISALEDEGYFPDCQVCGLDGEFEEMISYLIGLKWVFVCKTCSHKVTRRAGIISGICPGKGNHIKRSISPHDWGDFFEFALLEQLTNQATKG